MKNKTSLYINSMSLILLILIAFINKNFTDGWIAFATFQISARIGLMILPGLWVAIFFINALAYYLSACVTYGIYNMIVSFLYFMCKKKRTHENEISDDLSEEERENMRTKLRRLEKYGSDYLRGFLIGTCFYNILYHFVMHEQVMRTLSRSGLIMLIAMEVCALFVTAIYIFIHHKYMTRKNN